MPPSWNGDAKAPTSVVDVGRARHSDEPRDLLCNRLAAAARMLALFLGLLILRGLLLSDRPPIVLLAQAWAVVSLGIIRAWLANDRDLTPGLTTGRTPMTS